MVARRIRALLAHVPGLSVREAERLAGVPRGTVQKILDGRIENPGSKGIGALAGVLGCTTDYFIRDDKPPSADEVIAAVDAARAKSRRKRAA